MKMIVAMVVVLAVCLVPGFSQPVPAQKEAPKKEVTPALRQVQSIPLTGITGRLGHVAVDAKGERVFVAATEANTVEVFDLKEGAHLQSVKGFDKPDDVLLVPGSTHVYVSNADGKLRVFDSATWQQLKAIDLGAGSGRLRYDSLTKRIYAGTGSGSLTIVDPATDAKVGEVKLAGRPDSFLFGKTKIYVNVPQMNLVNVIDRKSPGTPVKVPVSWARRIPRWPSTKPMDGCW